MAQWKVFWLAALGRWLIYWHGARLRRWGQVLRGGDRVVVYKYIGLCEAILDLGARQLGCDHYYISPENLCKRQEVESSTENKAWSGMDSLQVRIHAAAAAFSIEPTPGCKPLELHTSGVWQQFSCLLCQSVPGLIHINQPRRGRHLQNILKRAQKLPEPTPTLFGLGGRHCSA